MTSLTQYDENKTCATKVRLKRHTAEVDGAYWNCKAGANGWCKYVGAVICTLFLTSLRVRKFHPTSQIMYGETSRMVQTKNTNP